MDQIKRKQKNTLLKITSYSRENKKNIFSTIVFFFGFYLIFQILNPLATIPVGKKPLITDIARATTTYTTSQVATHNTQSDCWIIVSDQVYNITALFATHSGGAETLLTCGADSTIQFNSHSHSSNVLAPYFLGSVGTAVVSDITAVGQTATKGGAQVSFVGALPNSSTGVNLAVVSTSTSSNAAPSGKSITKVFDITATNESGTTITTFGTGSTANVVLSYSGASTSDTVMYWNGSSWSSEGISGVTVNTSAGTVSFTTTHFSVFAILSSSSSGNGTVRATTSNLPTAGININNILINILISLCLAIIASYGMSYYKNTKNI